MSNKTFFGPGPSQIFPEVATFFQEAIEKDICCISHRSGAYKEIHKATVENLKKLVGIPDSFQVFFLGSASEAWERIFLNLVEEKSYHFVNGSFSKKFYSYGKDAGIKVEKLDVAHGEGFENLASLEIAQDIELIAFTQNETSSGVKTNEADIHLFRDKNPNAFIAVDVVSSFPHPQFDYSKIDTLFFSVQKCFGLPAGLGVWMVNERCIERAKALKAKGKSLGAHHSIPDLLKNAEGSQTPSTPNVLGIYLLKRVLDLMLEKGVDNIRKDTLIKKEILHDTVSKVSWLSQGVQNPNLQSDTVVVANTEILPSEINKKLAAFDLEIGAGYGDFKNSQIRIANFPAHSVQIIEKLSKKLKEL